jgi:diacylglycerol kinase
MKNIYGLMKSFYYAFHGFCSAVKRERNMRIHLTAVVFVTEFAIIYGLQSYEYAILCILFGVVIAAEMFNTAIEAAIDLVIQEKHPLARIAKDVAAGAVLVLAVISVIVGGVLFFHPEKLQKAFLFLWHHPLFIVIGCIEVILAILFIFYFGKGRSAKTNIEIKGYKE